MSAPVPDKPLLLIRCPSCGQRFKVGEDLMRRTVECGSCEHRFRIEESVVVRGRKFYPGERKNPMVGRFQRFQLASTAQAQAVQYGKPPDPSQYEPTPPLRIVAAAAGGCIMLVVGLLLILGADRNAVLDGMTTDRRLIMALFSALMGSCLLIYGNPKSRGKAILGGIIGSIALIMLPFFFQGGSVPLNASEIGDQPTAEIASGLPEAPALSGEELLLEQIGITPLQEEIDRLRSEGSGKTAIGLWLRNLRSSNRFLVRDFVIRTLKAGHLTHYYPRGNDNFLMVVSGIATKIRDVPALLAPLGEVQKIHEDLSVVEIIIHNENFVEGPLEKLTNKDNPAYYELNKRELESIDLDRVSKAVRRLADSEPRIYQSDITTRLTALLLADYVDFKGDVCRALKNWATDPGPPAEAALGVLRDMMQNKKRVPKEMVELIVAAKKPAVIPYLDQLWRESANEWEYLYSSMGPAAESAILASLTEVEGSQRHSALRIISSVGTSQSIAPLKDLLPNAYPELRVLIEKALASIQSRTGE